MRKRLSKLTEILLPQHGAVILCLHITLTLTSLLLAWLLRFEFVFRDASIILNAAPILVLCRLAAMARFKLLQGNWRYTGVYDANDIVGATVLGSAAFLFCMRIVLGVKAFPLSVYVIELLITGLFITAARVGLRVLAEAAVQVSSASSRKQVLIIGAGFAAQMITRELQGTESSYWVVGCLDDDPRKRGFKIYGKPVLGAVDDLPQIAAREAIDEVLIAVPSASSAQMRRFVDICQTAGVKFSTVPTLQDLLSGKANIQQLRQVDLDDLLGRDPVQIDLDSVRSTIEGKVVVVTGAAGSIGSELCRQLVKYKLAKLICLDQSETGLFYLERELKGIQITYCVADYTNSSAMKHILGHNNVDVIYHAAAYKHVPLMEENPHEAVRNNVVGFQELLQIAESAGCKAFILISSDKAVNPTNMMGATKRIGELMMCSRPRKGMRCVAVRFGNVLGSQGSVIPVFQKQIAEEKILTITHPDITRFFMTIPEAAALVLQASAVGNHGDVLVLDMGEPIRIVDLARTLIKLSGKSEKDVAIVYSGLRPGEKLYEELFYSNESVLDTNHSKIKRTKGTALGWAELSARLELLRSHVYSSSTYELRKMVQAVVPEYVVHPNSREIAEMEPVQKIRQSSCLISDSYETAAAQD